MNEGSKGRKKRKEKIHARSFISVLEVSEEERTRGDK